MSAMPRTAAQKRTSLKVRVGPQAEITHLQQINPSFDELSQATVARQGSQLEDHFRIRLFPSHHTKTQPDRRWADTLPRCGFHCQGDCAVPMNYPAGGTVRVKMIATDSTGKSAVTESEMSAGAEPTL